MTAIEESKDLDEIKVQELIHSLQTYELPLSSQRKNKSLTLKTINERIETQDSSDEDEVEKEVAYLAKNFCKFLKFKRDGKSFKKECPTYLKAKGKVLVTTLSDSDSSNSNSKESCDGEGNYFAFMTIAPIDFLEDLRNLVEELGEHTEVEFMGVGDESDDEEEECVYEGTNRLQEFQNALFGKSGEYARVAKVAIKKMEKAKQEYKSILVRYKETKCEVEGLNEELTNAYSRIKFLELEVIQANAKVECVTYRNLMKSLPIKSPLRIEVV